MFGKWDPLHIDEGETVCCKILQFNKHNLLRCSSLILISYRIKENNNYTPHIEIHCILKICMQDDQEII